jgi:hypothetical protein
VEDEHICLTFLVKLGLDVASVRIAIFGNRAVLLVERFDRLRIRPKRAG